MWPCREAVSLGEPQIRRPRQRLLQRSEAVAGAQPAIERVPRLRLIGRAPLASRQKKKKKNAGHTEKDVMTKYGKGGAWLDEHMGITSDQRCDQLTGDISEYSTYMALARI